MPSVKVRENEPFEFALRRFKRTCEKAGVLADTRKKEFYEKPTQERKRKAAAGDLLGRMRRDAATEASDMDANFKHPGLSAAEGLEAFGEGNYVAAFRHLAGARDAMPTVGGSHAQRDVFERLTIEAAIMPGKGVITRTGSLGDVMKESVEAARTVVRSRARMLGIKDDVFEKKDLHIHVPDGATPKDGPSAGAAMTTAMVSAMTGIPVRADVAMTGEITLRGEVTAIGGLKEKLLAALRGGIKTVLIPEDNVKDLQDIPENVKNGLEIVPVKWIDKVLEVALVSMPQALPDEEPVVVEAPVVADAKTATKTGAVKH
mgnify:CR=1 FL=1